MPSSSMSLRPILALSLGSLLLAACCIAGSHSVAAFEMGGFGRTGGFGGGPMTGGGAMTAPRPGGGMPAGRPSAEGDGPSRNPPMGGGGGGFGIGGGGI